MLRLPWKSLAVVLAVVLVLLAVRNQVGKRSGGCEDEDPEHRGRDCGTQSLFSIRPPDRTQGGYVTWQVTHSGFSNVRSGKHLFNRVIGMKASCLMFIARREGNWIRLLHEPGFMLISLRGQPLLQESNVRYSKITDGKCSDLGLHPVVNKTACEAAALALGLPDTSVNMVKEPKRPEGCYIVGGGLFLSVNPANEGRGATFGHEPICSSQAPGVLDPCLRAEEKREAAARLKDDESGEEEEEEMMGDIPSLFCFSIVRKNGYEEKLLMAQFENTASIFLCDGYKVLTAGGKMVLGQGWNTTEIDAPSRGLGKAAGDESMEFENTNTMMQAWSVILRYKKLWDHDWIVKVEPDAVFFPGRFRQYLRRNSTARHSDKVSFLNCEQLQGPPARASSIQVFSQRAMKAYSGGKARCRRALAWKDWEEDVFIERCLQFLGINSLFARDMVGGAQCWSRSQCSDLSKVAFHNFKSASSYMKCWEDATEAELAKEWRFHTVDEVQVSDD